MQDEPRNSSFLQPFCQAEWMTFIFERHVEPHEIGQRLLIGDDAADLSRGKEYVLGLFLGKELFDVFLTAEVKLLVGAGDDIVVALALQLTHDGAAHHAAVPGNVDFCIFVHHNKLPSFE